MSGWIKIHRILLKSPLFKSSESVHLWIYLLLEANFQPSKLLVGNKVIKINKGQVLTSRRNLEKEIGVNSSKIQRLLKLMEIEQQIEQQSFSNFRLITILNYDRYQASEPQSEPQVNHKRTTSEPQVNRSSISNARIKEGKEGKEGKEKNKDKDTLPGKPDDRVMEIFNFWCDVMKKGSRSKPTASRINSVKARLKDGYTIDEIKQAITNCSQSSFHMGPSGKGKHNDLELICRSTKFENFRDNIGKEETAKSLGITKGNDHSYDEVDYRSGATKEEDLPDWARPKKGVQK